MPDREQTQGGSATGAKPRFLCGSSGTKELAIPELRGSCWTDWPAVHAGGRNAHKDPAIEPGIPALQRAITGLTISQFHVAILAFSGVAYSRFSDMVIISRKSARHSAERFLPAFQSLQFIDGMASRPKYK